MSKVSKEMTVVVFPETQYCVFDKQNNFLRIDRGEGIGPFENVKPVRGFTELFNNDQYEWHQTLDEAMVAANKRAKRVQERFEAIGEIVTVSVVVR